MAALHLCHPVYTLDGGQLLSSGSTLTEETLNRIILSNKIVRERAFSVLAHGSIKTDLLDFLHQPPYNAIFSEPEKIPDLMTIMAFVCHGPAVLESLDYFKKNDFYTYRHILIVFALTTLLAGDLISSYHDMMQETAAGPCHDLGKICVPLHILKKSDPLTHEERDILEHHAAAGFVLLCYYLKDKNDLAARVALNHHERRNGSGYPGGIKHIDRLVEIVAVCDIYDALVSQRPYRPISYGNRTALEEITLLAEKGEISWEGVKALISHNRRKKPHYSQVAVSIEKRGTPPSGSAYGVIAA